MQKTNRPEFLISALLASLLIGFATSAACAQESGSATAVGPGPPQVLQGEIRWKKALGTVPIVAGLSAAHSDPCSAFSVVVVTPTDEQELIALIDKLTWKIRDGRREIVHRHYS